MQARSVPTPSLEPGYKCACPREGSSSNPGWGISRKAGRPQRAKKHEVKQPMYINHQITQSPDHQFTFESPLPSKSAQLESNHQHNMSIFWYNSQILSNP